MSIVSEAKYKTIQVKRLKILTPEQMLQRLLIALARVKVGNTSENLLNRKIRHILNWAEEITEKVYNKKMNSIRT